jgi:hypothetical protein
MKQSRKIYDLSKRIRSIELWENISELAKLELPLYSYIRRKEYEDFGGSFPVNGNVKQTPEQKQFRTWKKAKGCGNRTWYIKKAIGIFSKTVDDLYFH